MIETGDGGLDLSTCPALDKSRRFSLAAVADIGAALERSLDGSGGPILTVVAAGSLGRLEATEQSDVDCIVIVDDDAEDDPRGLARTIEHIAAEFPRVGLRPPKPDGIYCTPMRTSTLLDPQARGSLAESPAVFGSRMQLLLDAWPLFRADQFNSIREHLVNWYSSPTAHSGGWTHLLNDLSRYLHSYAVWQQFKFSRSDDDGWYLRQAKLRSTRVATFAGLMFLLGESSRHSQRQPAWLLGQLARTPLERLKRVFDAYPQSSFTDVMEPYEALHRMLSDSAVRLELIRSSPANATEVPLRHTGAYARVHEMSETLMGHLTHFILSRRDDWSPLIFRNWLL